MGTAPTRNPHEHPNYRERGPRAFAFTYADLAAAAGMTVGTVKVYATKRRGKVTPTSFESVAAFLVGRRRVVPRPVAADELARALGGEEAAARWRARWPLFELHWCSRAGCTALGLSAGLCVPHGGARPAVRLGPQGFEVLTAEGYQPFRSFVLGRSVRRAAHLDGNLWNNRVANLRPPRRSR